MTWYPDNVECDLLGLELAPYIRSIGWLDHSKGFAKGKTPASVYHALSELLKDPYFPYASPGVHFCNLCPYPNVGGTRNLLIPGNGFLYLCPELILHYITAHRYKPPEDFCQAALDCPSTNSMEYREKLLQNGGRKLV